MTPAQLRQADVSPGDLVNLAESYVKKNYPNPFLLVRSEIDPRLPDTLEHAQGGIAVRFAATPLELRYAVKQLAAGRNERYASIVVTSLRDDDVPLDVTDPLTQRNIVRVDASTRLRGIFSATRQRRGLVDNYADIPAVIRYLTRPDAPVVNPAGAGLLDKRHLNRELIRSLMNGDYPTSLDDVLDWSVRSPAPQQWAQAVADLSPAVMDGALHQLRYDLGSQADFALGALRRLGPRELFTFGVVAEMLIPSPVLSTVDQGDRKMFRAILKAEEIPDEENLKAWASAATSVARRQGIAETPIRAGIERAEGLVRRAEGFANPAMLIGSTLCEGGFQARANFLAEAISMAGDAQGTATAVARYTEFKAHELALPDNADRLAAEAALRLLNFYERDADETPTTLRGWIRTYLDTGSWYDSAVNHAWAGGANAALAEATRAVASRGQERRAAVNQQFAADASRSAVNSPLPGGVLGAEDVLDNVVAPLLDETNVLLLVVDGMGVTASNDLVGEILSGGFGAWKKAYSKEENHAAAVAVFPTLTTFSRTSLLSGRLVAGSQNDERTNLTDWFDQKVKLQRDKGDAKVFHKNDLNAGFDTVLAAVKDTGSTQLVAAVLNTIDDALDKSDPMSKKWSPKDIKRMGALLKEAGEVGRTVVLVSDHGHIVERHLTGVTPSSGDEKSARWRDSNGASADASEVEVSGSRVLSPGGSAILAVDEDVRYTAKKAGYHGGLTLQEAIIPITVLTQSPALAGYDVDNQLYRPSWWEIRDDARVAAPAAVPTVTRTPKAKPIKKEPEVPTLFDQGTGESSQSDAPWIPAWAQNLKDAKLFKERVKEAPNTTIDQAIGFLVELDANAGRMPDAVFREKFHLPGIRARGAVTELQRIVNMDGVEVLAKEGTDIVFHRRLLDEQFGLGG